MILFEIEKNNNSKISLLLLEKLNAVKLNEVHNLKCQSITVVRSKGDRERKKMLTTVLSVLCSFNNQIAIHVSQPNRLSRGISK